MRSSPSTPIPLKSEIYNTPIQYASKYKNLRNSCGKLPIEEPISILYINDLKQEVNGP